MKIGYGNYLEMSDEEIEKYIEGCEGFVFAAGVDERVEGPAPIYNMFKKYNIEPVKRLLQIAKKCGIKHTAICGSSMMKEYKKKNIEPGPNMVKFAALQCGTTFIDKAEGCERLGVKPDDIDRAVAESMLLCKDILNKKVNSISMRAE